MANVLIVYATTHGHTRLIADRMAAAARGRGHQVTLVSIDEQPADPSPGRFDAVMIGGSVHASQYSPKLLVYIRRYRQALAVMPTAFFSVGLGIASVREEDRVRARKCADDFLQRAEWKPGMVAVFAGALMYRRYGFFMRFGMRLIAKREGMSLDTSRDHVYTDWNLVDQFAADVLAPFDRAPHEHEAPKEPTAVSGEGEQR